MEPEEDLGFDPEAVHRYYSADCFSCAWELIDRTERSPEETDWMLHAVHAAAWHWLQRTDRNAESESVMYWQLSRAYALAGDASLATHCGERCLQRSHGLGPFYVGYAYEALAQAAQVGGDQARYAQQMAEARRWLERIPDADARAMLAADLDALEMLG